jgi:hypothetical protein
VKWPLASWKGATIQMGLEPGVREITIVRNCYQETSSNTVCVAVICIVWRSMMALRLDVNKSGGLEWSVNPISNPKSNLESLILMTGGMLNIFMA